jgi:hypothetical protein
MVDGPGGSGPMAGGLTGSGPRRVVADPTANETTGSIARITDDGPGPGAQPDTPPRSAVLGSVAAAAAAASASRTPASQTSASQISATQTPAATSSGTAKGSSAVDTSGPIESSGPAEDSPPGKRVRVVLSQRKGTATRPVRTVVDIQELTQVGELLSASLIRSQLALALRIGGVITIALGSLPAIFVIFPVLGRVEIFGVRLPWLLLGVLSYPFMLALGYLHTRSAERLEQVFADHIQS